MRCIKNFYLATEKGKNAGGSTIAKKWLRSNGREIMRYRRTCKFIWDAIVSTLDASDATTIIAGLKYGSGPALLSQIETQQQRQTTMALFTLFTQLITIQLRPKESLNGMFGRLLEIRKRLRNWRPPMVHTLNASSQKPFRLQLHIRPIVDCSAP